MWDTEIGRPLYRLDKSQRQAWLPGKPETSLASWLGRTFWRQQERTQCSDSMFMFCTSVIRNCTMVRALKSGRWIKPSPFIERRDVFQGVQKRLITIQDAQGILGVSHVKLTPKGLRAAYLEAAKRCHPDTQTERKSKQDAGEQFRQVSEAYEVLLGTNMPNFTNDFGITDAEEAEFRRACQEMLGVRAEIVEESKRCPTFRQWLTGKTDAAYTWQVFFMRYGGLAPKLRPSAGMIEGSKAELPKLSSRRRRPSRSINP